MEVASRCAAHPAQRPAVHFGGRGGAHGGDRGIGQASARIGAQYFAPMSYPLHEERLAVIR